METKVMYLDCKLTEVEVMSTAKTLASLLQKRAQLENQLSSFKKQLGSDIDACDAEISKAREMVASETEYREVECEVRRDWSRNVKTFVRTDTGEIVREEPIPELERQQKLGENLAPDRLIS